MHLAGTISNYKHTGKPTVLADLPYQSWSSVPHFLYGEQGNSLLPLVPQDWSVLWYVDRRQILQRRKKKEAVGSSELSLNKHDQMPLIKMVSQM